MNRKTGYVVLAVGLVLLLFTFYLALQAFLGPEFIQDFENLVQTNREGIAALVDVLIYLIPILLLVVMGAIGGKIMHYGIKLTRTPEPQTLAEKKEKEKTATSKKVKKTTPSKKNTPSETPPPPSKTEETKVEEEKTEPPKPQTPPEPEE